MRGMLCMFALLATAVSGSAQPGSGGPGPGGPDRFANRPDRRPEIGAMEEIRRLQSDLRRLEERLRTLEARMTRGSGTGARPANARAPRGPAGFDGVMGRGPGGFGPMATGGFGPQRPGGFGSPPNPEAMRGSSFGGGRRESGSGDWERRLDRIQQELDSLRHDMRNRR